MYYINHILVFVNYVFENSMKVYEIIGIYAQVRLTDTLQSDRSVVVIVVKQLSALL